MKKIVQILFLLFINHLFSQEVVYEIMNTSVNSNYAEFGVTYLNNNSVLFASSKKDENDVNFRKTRRRNNNQLFLEMYHGVIDKNGDIIQADKFSKEIKQKFFESDISFTPDFKSIYFTWNNFYDSQKKTDSAKWKTLNLFKASIDENFKITNLLPLTFNSKNYSVKNPEVSKDGKQLYFVSDMPNGYGNFDIYVVNILSNGSHSSPKNLGSTINTKYNDLYPFIDENNTLYFSTYGHRGKRKGNLDIFKSEFIDNSFQRVQNLQAPLNSKYDDFAFVIDSKTNTGFFSSTRKGGKGDADIYAFKIKEPALIIQECTQTITGEILDSNTKKHLLNATITIFNGNNLVKTIKLNNQATFNYEVNCNSRYRIVASLKNYANDITIIHTSSISNRTIKRAFLLEPHNEFVTVRNQKMIETKSIDFDLDKSKIIVKTAIELDKVIDILNRYPKIKLEIKSHTDSRAPDSYNLKLSDKRAKSIINYIITNGIDPERITGRGYGETELLNNCSNGVNCSQSEHAINKRTEFIVIDE